MVLDAHEEGVVGGLELRQAPQGLDLAGKAVLAVQARALVRKIGRVPAQGVAEQARHLVIQVVARGQCVETFVQGHLVEEMPFDLAAGRADGTVEAFLDQRDGQALGGQFLDHELQAVLGAKTLHHAAGHGRGFRDAQIDVQAGDVIALPGKLQHQGQRILAARKGHEDAFVTGEELLAFDALFHLTGKELEVTVGAEGGVVAA